jgi:hypothetical protein
MSFQNTSTFLPAGIPGEPGVVSQVFFPTDVSHLDDFDITVLDSLCRHCRRILQNQRVELSFIGHADARHDTNYNLGLGERRARSVQNFVDQRLTSFRLYTSWPAVSAGEGGAVQPNIIRGREHHAPREQLAKDRRVDIYSTFHPQPKIPPVATPPRILRPTFRQFIRTDREEFSVAGEDHSLRDALLAIPDLFADPFTEEPGEEIRDPRAQLLDATFRVNRVRIDVTVRDSIDLVADPSAIHRGIAFTEYRTDVQYDWGRPNQHVLIERQIHFRRRPGDGGQMVHQPTQTRTVLRSQADRNPFLFPVLRDVLQRRIEFERLR